MIKNILQLYALLVCFITVIILIITCSLSLNYITDLLIPEYKYYSALRHYDSNEDFIEYYERYEQTGKQETQKIISLKQLTPSQLDEKRLNERRQYLEGQKVETIASLILTFQWIFIAMIFFFIHWKVYKKSEK